MSVRNSLLALLDSQPMYGAQLKAEFEARTGGQWPLNIGQVYTTLGRLERDGLVEGAGTPDADGRIPYRLTDAGRAEVLGWWDQAVPRDVTPRNELAIKFGPRRDDAGRRRSGYRLGATGCDVDAPARTQPLETAPVVR